VGHSQIADLLGKIGMLDDRQVDAVMSRAGSASGGYVVMQVAELGYASESAVARAVSIELGLPRIDLSVTPPEPDALELLDGRICVDRLVLPVALRENGDLLWLAMADPTDAEAMTFVRKKTMKRVRPAVAGPSEIIRKARDAYGVQMPRMSSAKGEHDLGAIDMAIEEEGEGERLEVVNVMDESASPLARIAAQLGIAVPESLPSGGAIDVPLSSPTDNPIDLRPPALTTPPSSRRAGTVNNVRGPQPPVMKPRPPPPVAPIEHEIEIEVDPPEPMAPAELSPEELHTLEQIRASLEKQAHVLKTLVSLCIEKGVFTREEMARKRS
jgi:hypothetical protein